MGSLSKVRIAVFAFPPVTFVALGLAHGEVTKTSVVLTVCLTIVSLFALLAIGFQESDIEPVQSKDPIRLGERKIKVWQGGVVFHSG